MKTILEMVCLGSLGSSRILQIVQSYHFPDYKNNKEEGYIR